MTNSLDIVSSIFSISFLIAVPNSSRRLHDRPSIVVRFIYDLRERVTICPGERERNSLAPSHRNTINGVELSSRLRVSYYVQLA